MVLLVSSMKREILHKTKCMILDTPFKLHLEQLKLVWDIYCQENQQYIRVHFSTFIKKYAKKKYTKDNIFIELNFNQKNWFRAPHTAINLY